MVGSDKPRPQRPGVVKRGRKPGALGVPSLLTEARERERTDLMRVNPSSSIYVDGRSTIGEWTGPLRQKFRELSKLAAEFGLFVCEVAPHGGRTRRILMEKQTSWDEAYAAILDAPGISFEAWLTKAYPIAADPSPTIEAANRLRARTALSRLVDRGFVRRLKNSDGVQILWPMRQLYQLCPPPIPPDLLQLRANQLK